MTSQILAYADSTSGLITASDGGRDNLVLFTVTAMIIPRLMSDAEGWDLAGKINSFLDLTEIKIGLFERLPGARDNSVDNLVATAAFSDQRALEIWTYGSQNDWCFNPAEPGVFNFKYWYWPRFIGILPHIKACAGKPLNIVDTVLWSVACIFSALSARDNTSDKCLQFIMNHSMEGRSKLCDWTISQWRWLMQKKYPSGMAEVYAIYFGPKHPFAVNGPRGF